MTASRTVEQKVADWFTTYQAIRDELTPEAFRVLTTVTANSGEQGINFGVMVARTVFANDRAAATVAALLTQSGIKPVAIGYGDTDE